MLVKFSYNRCNLLLYQYFTDTFRPFREFSLELRSLATYLPVGIDIWSSALAGSYGTRGNPIACEQKWLSSILPAMSVLRDRHFANWFGLIPLQMPVGLGRIAPKAPIAGAIGWDRSPVIISAQPPKRASKSLVGGVVNRRAKSSGAGTLVFLGAVLFAISLTSTSTLS